MPRFQHKLPLSLTKTPFSALLSVQHSVDYSGHSGTDTSGFQPTPMVAPPDFVLPPKHVGSTFRTRLGGLLVSYVDNGTAEAALTGHGNHALSFARQGKRRDWASHRDSFCRPRLFHLRPVLCSWQHFLHGTCSKRQRWISVEACR